MFSITFFLFLVCLARSSYAYQLFHQWHVSSLTAREFELDLLSEVAKHGIDYISFDSKSDAIVKSDTSRFPSFLDEFSIVATVRAPFRGGYVFSIVKPLDSIVALGVSLYPLTHRRNSYNISLTYTNTHLFTKNQNVATFQFTYAKSSIDLSLKVTTHYITLFIGCTELKTITRDPIHSIYDPDAKFFVDGTGTEQGNGFQGSLERMILYGDPDTAQAICRNAMVDEPVFLVEEQIRTTTERPPPIFATYHYETTTQPIEDMNTIIDYTIPSTTRSNLSIKLVALNEPYSGNMHGIRGSDYSCYRQAARAGLRGTYKAFLHSRTQRLQTLVQNTYAELPVANIRGEILFNSWNSIFDTHGEMSYQSSRILSFNGRDVLFDKTWPLKKVWHGITINGEKTSEDLCGSWETDRADKYGVASNLLNKRLLGYERLSCDNQFIVLCIEISPFKTVL